MIDVSVYMPISYSFMLCYLAIQTLTQNETNIITLKLNGLSLSNVKIVM